MAFSHHYSPCTNTGVRASDVELLPSCPEPFTPQHSAPALVSAHVRSLPAEIASTPLLRPCTGVAGGDQRSVVVLSPSWPLRFEPQHQAEPLTSEHVWAEPAATA